MTKPFIKTGEIYLDSLFDTEVKIEGMTDDTVCVLEPDTENKHLYGKEEFALDTQEDKRFTPLDNVTN